MEKLCSGEECPSEGAPAARGKRAALAMAASVAFCSLIYLFLVSEGTFRLLGAGLRSAAYDSLASSILSGRADVDPSAIQWEGYEIEGRHYMYFGPLPALVRMPLNALAGPDYHGLWARLSCLSAAAIAVAFGAAIVGASAGSLAAVAFGTPLVYLIASPRIYNEAILWGVAWELGALLVFLRLAHDGERRERWLGLLSVFAALSLLSRVTCGIGAYSLLAAGAWIAGRSTGWPGACRAILPAALGIAAQLVYNHARFGSVLAFDHPSYVDVEGLGGALNAARLPSTAYNYLAPRLAIFSSDWPFLRLLPPLYFRPEFFLPWREEVLPLAIGSIWLLLAASRGMASAPGARHAACLALLPQVLVLLSYYAVTERYAAEVALPLFALAAAGPRRAGRRSPGERLAIVFSCAVTLWFTAIWVAFGVGETGLSEAYQDRAARLFVGDPAPSGADVVPVGEREAIYERRDPGARLYFTDSDRDHGGPTFLGAMLDRSIVMEADSHILLEAPSGARAFEALVGFVDTRPRCSQGETRVFVLGSEGEILYDSGTVRRNEMPRRVRVPVSGGRNLSLVVDRAGGRSICDIMVWAYPSWRIGDPP